ncbi:MAG: ABC transporter ATP-binding protein [Acidimicrobiia bacterium]|nr:ABC transporter ATP-binding protein [Acidimicrobiia bacterium]
MALFEVNDLTVDVRVGEEWMPALHGASFKVDAGEVLALVGESGSGKSLMAIGSVDLLRSGAQVTGGEVLFEGKDLHNISEDAWRELVGLGIGVLFQDPIGSWDPMMAIGIQSGEGLEEHFGLTREEIEHRVHDALGEVQLPQRRRFMQAFSYEISRGEAQRAILASALLSEPRLLIADEPLSGLDVTVATAVLSIIEDLRRKRGMAMILVTHDLGVVAGVADRVAVVYGGRIVEEGDVTEIFHSPKHPYTAGLLASLPAMGRRLEPIPGDADDISFVPDWCAFAARCQYAIRGCHDSVPDLKKSGTGAVRCIRSHELELRGVGS